ncbi:hypothetical protein [Bacillus paralicheniformis]|uniref:hypothetical protein n=1 Tax=Bacillus paralicheniformis TaxID=1648923 RepID=UPI0011AADA67|nr:hypothetical protein [Bacillus paralicheniformis]
MSISLTQYLQPLPNIALFAKTRSGKDEVFKILKEIGWDVERYAFGDAMKEKFYEIFPDIPREPKPIKAMIDFGEAMRKIDPYVWVKPTMNIMKRRKYELAQAGLQVPSFVVTDVRNWEEYRACKDAGFTMVKVWSSEKTRINRMRALGEEVSRKILDAPTEKRMDQFNYDFVIENDTDDLDTLANNVVELVYQIQSKRGKYHVT